MGNRRVQQQHYHFAKELPLSQQEIMNRLMSLEELDGISVKVTGPAKGVIRITHSNHHAAEFVFRWNHGHFIGYFVDGAGTESQAVVSLHTPMDAIRFVAAYAMLNEIRAKKAGG
jgi:hypothetical protein